MSNGTQGAVLTRTRGWRVVYCGGKATDATRLWHLSRALTVFSVVGNWRDIHPEVDGVSVEELIGRRPDYDRFSWDSLHQGIAERIVRCLDGKTKESLVLLVPFSASWLFSNIALTLSNCHLAGNFVAIEQAFHHKPWAEAEMRRDGIPVAPWQHLLWGRAAIVTGEAGRWLTRLPASTGGLGLRISDSAREAQEVASLNTSGDISSICPYYEDAMSLNVNACLFPSGRVTVHPLSLQIIGESECTDRQFGYCGNDFGAASTFLDKRDHDIVESIVIRVGGVLRRHGYLGAYGLDLLKTSEGIVVSEINPRFQASSYLGAQLTADTGLPDLYIDHVAAHIGVEPCEHRPALRELVRMLRPLSQVFCYKSTLDTVVTAGPTHEIKPARLAATDLVLSQPSADQHALLFRLVADESVLGADGRLAEPWCRFVRATKHATLASLH